MTNERLASELVKIAESLTAKADINFQGIASQLDEIIDQIDDHMNVYNRDYDRGVSSRIDKATRQLISAKEAFAETDAYDEDPYN